MEQLFSGDLDIERIIQGLKIESGVNIEPENTLLIFDEIQETPKALTALKYFYEFLEALGEKQVVEFIEKNDIDLIDVQVK